MWLFRIGLLLAFCSICVLSNPPPVFILNGILGAKLYIQEDGVQYPTELKCKPSKEYRKIWITNALTNIWLLGDHKCEFFRLSYHLPGKRLRNGPNGHLTHYNVSSLGRGFDRLFPQRGTNNGIYVKDIHKNPVFNAREQTFYNQPGVNITTPMGNLEPLQCLIIDTGLGCSIAASAHSFSSAYFYYFVDSIKRIYHFTESENLFGAAYDWRYPPEMQKEYFESLKREIEKAVDRTGLRAFILAHRHGMDWHGVGVVQETVRDFARTLPSMGSLLPSTSLFNSSRILVSVGNKTFTSADMKEFLALINSSNLFTRYGQSEEIQPDVPMLVVIGNLSKSTPSRYTYAHSIDEEPIEELKVDGDERIEAAVIEELCQKWSKNGLQIEVKHLPKEHTELIMSEEFVNIFGNAVIRKLPVGQRYPMLRNVALDRGNKICFSAEPYARCHTGTPPLKSLVQIAQFVCFHQESEIARELTKQEAKNMIFDLTEYKVAFSAPLEVAQICVDV